MSTGFVIAADNPSSQGSPEAYRSSTTQLAALTGGRVVSVEYRLAPQNPFPAALLDVLVAYLSLLYPHPSSAHEAVDPSHIVFAGDSSGGILLLNLLQIAQLTLQHAPVKFNSHTIRCPILLPAGLATLSFVGDLMNSLPSYTENRVNDLYLDIPWAYPDYPTCPIWPTVPPRPTIYAPTATCAHPLITPALAHSYTGMPPMWFAVGEEQFVDSAKVVARRAIEQGVQVDWLQFQAMPHYFAALPGLSSTPQAKLCMQQWAAFCNTCIEPASSQRLQVRATEVAFADRAERDIPFGDASAHVFPLAEVDRQIYTRIHQMECDFKRA
ncbi:MAG: hypothetical protein Q9209_001277 [Squamulea sp. 1 TL-2023]